MRFLKVFLSAVFLFAFFNAHAQPITGAFGLKLGQHVPNWVEGDERMAVLTDFKDDFFDTVKYRVLPYSKRIYWISARKTEKTPFCYKVRDALISVLREKYSKHEIKPGESLVYFEAKDGDKEISLWCQKLRGEYTLGLNYMDASLSSEFSKEQTLLEKRNIDEIKRNIDESKL